MDDQTANPQRTKASPLPQPTALTPLPQGTKSVIRQGRQAVVYHIPTSPPSPAHPNLKTTISLPTHSTWTSGLHFHTQHTEYLRLLKGSIFVYLDGQVNILSAKAGGLVCRGGDDAEGKSGLQVTVEKYARHEWGRAKEYLATSMSSEEAKWPLPDDIDDEVVVEEWTDPVDIGKALFFWNLNGIILTSPSAKLSLRKRWARYLLGGYWVPFQLFNVFWCLDNWPVFVDLRGALGFAWLVPAAVWNWVGHRVPFASRLEWPSRKLEGSGEWIVAMVVLGFVRVMGWMVGVEAVEKERTPLKLWEVYKRGKL